MNLPQVRLVRIARHARAMLYRLPRVSIAVNAAPGDEQDAKLIRLAEAVGRTSADRDDTRTHGDPGKVCARTR